jgi:aspartyl-tRNA(Asn)/glutamyl-tRNA(Gln) amidotransferase subunit C
MAALLHHLPYQSMLTISLRISVAGIPTKRAAMSTCMASKVEPPNIAHLCEKARLSLTPQEVEEFEPQIGRIVDWFAQLQEIDVADVAPAIHVGDVNGINTLRSDEPNVFPNRKAMMGAVPELEGSFIKVPKILKENQE